ncbi:MAG: hypothetical protein HFI29_12700 [Lachnospiraceae bacterium]|jgi:hypothetical protein|nr:hypothetical protein [Lachnospiraceae bacterium]
MKGLLYFPNKKKSIFEIKKNPNRCRETRYVPLGFCFARKNVCISGKRQKYHRNSFLGEKQINGFLNEGRSKMEPEFTNEEEKFTAIQRK